MIGFIIGVIVGGVGEDNQTDAVIKNDHAMLCVPIDDLEAVEE